MPEHSAQPSRFVKTAEAAELVELSKSALEKMRFYPERGGPPYVKLGRSIRYERAALEAWIAARTIGRAS